MTSVESLNHSAYVSQALVRSSRVSVLQPITDDKTTPCLQKFTRVVLNNYNKNKPILIVFGTWHHQDFSYLLQPWFLVTARALSSFCSFSLTGNNISYETFKTRYNRRRETSPRCRHLAILTNNNIVTASDVRLVPQTGEFDETYVSFLILSIRSNLWEHDVQNIGLSHCRPVALPTEEDRACTS